ncbi:MAG: guanylate kinase [Clostridia bacterium]|nr:guanylate kinase [Clostridia bacterium]
MTGGLVFIISGPAGSGKGTLVSEVLARDDRLMCAVSATSRPILKGETDGVNYHYITRAQFEEKIAHGEVLEYTEYCGNYYGTLKSEFERAGALGKHLILEIEVDGATQIKKKYPGAILVMVTPPNAAEQKKRLIERGRDTEESMQRRLTRAEAELDFLPSYDYRICNASGGLDRAADDFFAIVRAEELRTCRAPDFKAEYFGKTTR